MSACQGFTVIDLETTGLFPGGNDRILEIALISIDSSGRIFDTYTTLVNPERDVGATHVHGITAGEVVSAPLFKDIVGDVLSRLENAYVVAHNASFDRRFLHAETQRLGIDVPELPTLCTMMLAGRADPGIPGRKLDVICEHFGIALTNAHSAFNDAKATSALFSECVKRLGGWGSFPAQSYCIKTLGCSATSWPKAEPTGATYTRSEAATSTRERESYLQRLIAKLPSSGPGSGKLEEYMALLDRVLEDRRITDAELEELWNVASELELSRDQAGLAHSQYVTDLTLVALEDDIITPAEEADLAQVCRLLGLSESQIESARCEARELHRMGTGPTTASSASVEGMSVCFTGSLSCCICGERATKAAAKEHAERCGMLVQKRVTNKLDLLVVADPDSQSGKTKKARDYGIRVVAEPVFWRMVGVNIE